MVTMSGITLGILLWTATNAGQIVSLADGPKSGGAPVVPLQTVPLKIVRYAQRVVQAYDRDGDSRLQSAEFQAMAGQPSQADADRDGVITVEEFARYVAEYAQKHTLRLSPLAGQPATLPPVFTPSHVAEGGGAEPSSPDKSESATTPAKASPVSVPGGQAAEETPDIPPGPRRETKFYVSPKRLPAGLPDWFLQRDQDGDGQLTLAEFAPKPTPAQLAEFARMDTNRDGLVTARECQRALGSKIKKAKR